VGAGATAEATAGVEAEGGAVAGRATTAGVMGEGGAREAVEGKCEEVFVAGSALEDGAPEFVAVVRFLAAEIDAARPRGSFP
jgi:hypothetical protein